jgi:glycerophosphoryl diester phosphodiesterase
VLVIGHRGAAGHAPENTLRSIAFAIDCGADAVEIDVRLLDGALIVLHDAQLDRTTSGAGHYKSTSLTDLRRLDAGGGERIPLLDEVVALIGGRVGLNVEVKEPGIAERVVATLDRLTADRPAWRAQLLLSAFDVATTAELARLRGSMRLGVLYEGAFAPALARAGTLGAYSLHMPLKALAAADVRLAQARGLAVYVYTVNMEADIRRCLALGVDGVFSDYPDRALACVREAATGSRRGPGS